MEYNLQSIQHTMPGNALKIEISGGVLELSPYSDSIVRVRFAPTHEFSTEPSLMVVDSPDIPVAFNLSETTEALTLSTPKLSIRINRQTGAFTYLDSSGQLLTKEPDRGGKTLMPVDVVRSVFDETGRSTNTERC